MRDAEAEPRAKEWACLTTEASNSLSMSLSAPFILSSEEKFPYLKREEKRSKASPKCSFRLLNLTNR